MPTKIESEEVVTNVTETPEGEVVAVTTEPVVEDVTEVEEKPKKAKKTPKTAPKEEVPEELPKQFVEGQLVVRITDLGDKKQVLTAPGVTYTFSDEEFKMYVK